MKIIKPYAVIESTQDGKDLLLQIERAGRTSYKSEANIAEGSAEKFIRSIIKRGHESVIEHGSISVRFVCDRGVTHEMVRHRLASYTQESTRYVESANYKNKEFDVEDVIRLYKMGLTAPQIERYAEAHNANFTARRVYNILSYHQVHKEDQLDYNYFDTIDTPRKAYLLGLIQADGSTRKNRGSYVLSISQNKDEMWYIEGLIREDIGFKFKAGGGGREGQQAIAITNEHLVTQLWEKGIIPNKTYDQTLENIAALWDSIPNQYKWDFIHGLFDGDGSIKFGSQTTTAGNPSGVAFSIVGNLNLLNKIADFVRSELPGIHIGMDDLQTYAKLRIHHTQYLKDFCKKMLANAEFPFSNPHKTQRIVAAIPEIKLPFAKFGSEQFQVIVPYFLVDQDFSNPLWWIWMRAMYQAEESYSRMRLLGATPEAARSVLPNSIKTEIVMTANPREWRHFLKLRGDKAAHPDIRYLARNLCKQLQEKYPVLFDDITWGEE